MGCKIFVVNVLGRVIWDNVGVRFFEGICYCDVEDVNVFSMLDGEVILSICLGE